MSIPLAKTREASPGVVKSFEDLISPVTEAEFFDRYWGKDTLVVKRKSSEYYGELFSLADIDRFLLASAPSSTTVLQIVPPPNSNRESKLLTASGTSKDRLYNAFLSGDTIRLIGIEKFWPPLALLIASLQEVFNARFGVNAFLTPPQSQGFSLHFDTVDVFVMQLSGAKKWYIWESTYELPMDFPLSELHTQKIMEKNESRLKLREEVLLQSGDFFYMPRGYYHKAIAVDEHSLHLTLTVHPLFWLDFVKRAFELAAIEDVLLRQALPPGFVVDDRVQVSMVEEFRRILRRFCDNASFDSALHNLIEEYVGARTFPADGHFEALVNLPALSMSALVERRPGLICLVEVSENKATIKFGPNSIQGPAAIAPALEFVRDRPRFRVMELPGDLSAESKVVLARRMIREGLLSPVVNS